jgi:hypothetical protein
MTSEGLGTMEPANESTKQMKRERKKKGKPVLLTGTIPQALATVIGKQVEVFVIAFASLGLIVAVVTSEELAVGLLMLNVAL